MIKAISVFCGSSTGFPPIYTQTAQLLGKSLAEKNIELVYGAGNIGLMGIVADATLENGGKVLGVIPEFLKNWEVCHTGLTELIVTDNMHQRKQIIDERSDAVIALPGGYGTLDELFEILTWRQLHLHNKPIGVLNVNGYYDHMILHCKKMVEDGFLKADNLNLFVVAKKVEEMLAKLNENVELMKNEGKWIR